MKKVMLFSGECDKKLEMNHGREKYGATSCVAVPNSTTKYMWSKIVPAYKRKGRCELNPQPKFIESSGGGNKLCTACGH